MALGRRGNRRRRRQHHAPYRPGCGELTIAIELDDQPVPLATKVGLKPPCHPRHAAVCDDVVIDTLAQKPAE